MPSSQATQFAKRERARSAVAVVGVDAGKYQHAMVVRVRGRADARAVTFATRRPGFEQAVAAIRSLVGDVSGEVLVGVEFAGAYGFTFAHYLHALGSMDGLRFGVVSVLPMHTKRWKEVTHRQPLKTDAKDAVGIADLTAQGHYVGFPFLAPEYAERRRHLLSMYARGDVRHSKRSPGPRTRSSLRQRGFEGSACFCAIDRLPRTFRIELRERPSGPCLFDN
jgi:transposase